MKTRISIALLLVVLMSTVTSYASALQWEERGIPIRQGLHIDWTIPVQHDANGNSLVVWADMRSGYGAMYAQLLNPYGEPQWAEGGVVVTEPPAVLSDPNSHQDPAAAAVDGGWIVTWIDFRADLLGDIWAQKLDYSGQRLWSANNYTGVCVDAYPTLPEMFTVMATHDGTGGAIISWQEMRENYGEEMYARRVQADGSPAWANTVKVSNSPANWKYAVSTSDGQGNQLMAWANHSSSAEMEFEIYAAKITPDAAMPWGEGGILIAQITTASATSIAYDGAGGCYVSWYEEANENYDPYMQRVSADGTLLWNTAGLRLSTSTENEYSVQLTPNWNNGVIDGCIATWMRYHSYNWCSELIAQKVSADGQTLWQEGGTTVIREGNINDCHERQMFNTISDLEGGLVSSWKAHEGSSAIWSVYAARMNSEGSLLWSGNEVMLDETDGSVNVGPMVTDGHGGVFAFWQNRYAENASLRTQRIDLQTGSILLPAGGLMLAPGMDGWISFVSSVPVANHNVAMVWVDGRNHGGYDEIYYQIIDTLGNLKFQSNGRSLIQDTSWHSERYPALCTDDNGGFFVSYSRAVDYGSTFDLRMVHVNGQGEIISAPEGSVIATLIEHSKSWIAPDGAGGCYLVWGGYDFNYNWSLMLMRVNSACQQIWAQPTTLIEDEYYGYLSGIASNPDGSCVVSWIAGYNDNQTVTGVRVSTDGTITWNKQICDVTSEKSDPTLIADGQGGAFFTWTDQRDELYRVYAQHVSADGLLSWEVTGIPVTPTGMISDHSTICTDHSGNLFVAYLSRIDEQNCSVRLQKISASSHLLLPDSGVVMSNTSNYWDSPLIQPDSWDGVLVLWHDLRNPGHNQLYGTHLDGNGMTVNSANWPQASGARIGDPNYCQGTFTVAEDGIGGWIITSVNIQGSVDESYGALYAQRVIDGHFLDNVRDDNSEMPFAYSLAQNFPNPFNPSTQINFDLPRAGDVTLKVFDVLGREVSTLTNGKLNAGSYHILFDASNLPSGMYVYRLQTNGFEASKKMVLVK